MDDCGFICTKSGWLIDVGPSEPTNVAKSIRPPRFAETERNARVSIQKNGISVGLWPGLSLPCLAPQMIELLAFLAAHIFPQTATNATCTAMLVHTTTCFFQLCAERVFAEIVPQDYDCSIEHAGSRIMTKAGVGALKQMGEHAIQVLRRLFIPILRCDIN